jgi:glycosyltransferase involved in cell wall biosynthesis
LRIGIWCMEETDTGPASILPGEGVGGFVHNLVGGLMELDEPVEVALVVHPRDQDRMASHYLRHGGRVRVLSRPNQPPPAGRQIGKLLTAWVHQSEHIHGRLHGVRIRLSHARAVTRKNVSQVLRALLTRASAANPLALSTLIILLPLFFILAWCACGATVIARAVLIAMGLPLAWLDRALRRAQASPRFRVPAVPVDADPTVTELIAVIDKANCAMWLLPSLRCNHDIGAPSLQFIPHLAEYHFPDFFDPDHVNKARLLAPLRAQQALLVACTSAFIRDQELLEVLQLPPAKVRMVPPATTGDLPVLDDGEAAALRPAALTWPYVFCPAASARHHNVQGLIKTLRRLRDRYGIADLDLVLTGDSNGKLLPEHHRLVEAYGLEGRVHVLNKVDRRQLAALYRGAFATFFPGLYESSAAQIAEALHCRCPVACSRIPVFLEQCEALGKAMLYFDPLDADSIARAALTIRDYRDAVIRRQQEASKVLWQRTWKQAAAEWLTLFKETAEIAGWPAEYRARVVRCPWPAQPLPPPRPDEPLEMFLFLQHPYLGGVWESTRELIKALIEINTRRRRLKFTLGVQEEQADLDALRQIAGAAPIERMRFEVLTQAEAARLLPGPPSRFGIRPDQVYCFWSACARTALRADAWLALCDRFHNALLPARPYGVIVHDMIQRHVPYAFSPTFFAWRERGMIPTIKRANIVITTSPATRDDVIAEYGLDTGRLRLVPVACEPQRRFAELTAEHVPLPARPFILHAANTSEHKGAGVMLRACGRLKERLGEQAPMLVMCGGFTEYFAPSRDGTVSRDEPHWRNMRTLVRDLELEEGQDVVFLGFVNDRQLLDLYQRCAVVVNAARHDNGSFCLIEGWYFGKPIISSRYPAAESLCQRFGIPAKFFPIDEAAVLADLLVESVNETPLSAAALAEVRANLADPEFSVQCYAESLYEILVELAQHGRQERYGQPIPTSTAA